MNAAERRKVRQARVLIKAGDRAAAIAVLCQFGSAPGRGGGKCVRRASRRAIELQRWARSVEEAIRRGDVDGAIVLVRSIVPAVPPRRGDDSGQLVFRVDSFHCERLHLDMTVEECIQRRCAVWPSGRRKGAPKCLHCQDCETGRALAFACPGIELRRPSQAPEVLPEQQRRAKRAKALVVLEPGETWSLDPLTEASEMTRDDDTDWRA